MHVDNLDKSCLFEAIECWRKYRAWTPPFGSPCHKACCKTINDFLVTHRVYIDRLSNGRYRWRIVKRGLLGRIFPVRGNIHLDFYSAARELGGHLYTKAYIKYNKGSAASYKIC